MKNKRHEWNETEDEIENENMMDATRVTLYEGKNLKHNGPYNKAEPARRGGEPHWNPVLWCADAGTEENGGGDGAFHGECGGDVILYFKMGWKIPFWETYSTRQGSFVHSH